MNLMTRSLISFVHRYKDGTNGYKQDYEMTVIYFSKAAHKGNAEGIYNSAHLTSRCLGVKQNHKLSIELLKKAAKQSPKLSSGLPNAGAIDAQHALGLSYEEDVGIRKDISLSQHWYSIASENGSGDSANNLGLMFTKGNGIERNLEKAKQYLSLARTRKCSYASGNLALLYLMNGDFENSRI